VAFKPGHLDLQLDAALADRDSLVLQQAERVNLVISGGSTVVSPA